MSDAEIFARFIQELRSLLSAIESHGPSLATDASEKSRQAALSEVSRLARAASHLARSFVAEDIAAVTEAMAWATGQSGALGQGARNSSLSPALVRDTLAYLRHRADALGAAERFTPPNTADAEQADRLLMDLHAQVVSSGQSGQHGVSSAPHLSPHGSYTSANELTQDELAFVQSFANADLRPRDPHADAQLLARVGEPPAFLAQTESGAHIPVFGGMTAEEFDQIPPEMKLVFVKESQNDLREIGQYVVDFEQRPEDFTALARMSYLAHKLKGSAATMGFNGFANIAASFQDAVAAVQSRGGAADALVLSGLARFLEIFEIALASAQALEEPTPELVDDAHAMRDALQHAPTSEQAVPPGLAGPQHVVERFADRSHSADGALMLHVETRKLDVIMNQLSALAANRGAVARNLTEIARVQSEMQVALAKLREKSTLIADAHPLTYDNLASMARNGGAEPSEASATWAVNAAARLSGPLASTPSNLQLEQYTEMDGALRALAEVVADVTANYGALANSLSHLGRLTEAQEDLTREMQGEAMGIRLGRLSELTPRLRISARVAAADFGKMIEFDVQGDEIEIDRSLIEKLEQPLIQLVRNAIAHGVESPVDRVECGKPTAGKVCLRAYNVGSEVVLEVSDDGRGVNANLLVGAAIGAELITPQEARGLSHEQAMSFMFHEGITTSDKTVAGYSGALAGTGIGLADVADTIRALKGTISIRSELGKGSTFEIRAPISLSMLPILEVRAAGQALALPFAMVESTAFIEPGSLRAIDSAADASGPAAREWRVMMRAPASGAGAVAQGAETTAEAREIPAYALAEALGFVQDPEALRQFAVLNLDGSSVALLVEAVGHGDVREEVVRPLPRRMQRRAVRGVIVRPEDGEVALLIDPHEALARRLTNNITLRPARTSGGPRATAPNVMVVDDSVTIRRTLEQMLTSAGFKITLAHDGFEALEMMENELPSVVILDVEMPRLSGFELLRIIRTSPQYERVRVAMLTSRAADKHREYAQGLGADAYLVKPCPQDILVSTIERLLKEPESK